VVLAVAAVVFAADAISKAVVVDKLAHRGPVHLVGSVLTLTLTRNAGAAFSVGVGATLVFTAVAAVVIVVIVRTAARLRSRAWAVALGLLLGGACGNLADRLFRSPGPLRGEVVDWIHLTHWPVFNVADAAITCGAILALLLSARGRPVR
jgi:signal peptidase II